MTRFPLGSSSVVTKVLIACTGLAMVLFLVAHLAGNLLLYVGPAAFNGYSHHLITNPFIIPAEVGLVLLLVIHSYKTVTNWFENRQARPSAYVKKAWAGEPSRKSLGSTTMIWTGLATAVFVVLHVKTFKYGPYYQVAGSEERDLYRLVLEVFRQPAYVGFYAACMVLIGLHLWHGFASAFESLGLHSLRLTPRLLLLGRILAVVVAGGFLLIPLWVFVFGRRS